MPKNNEYFDEKRLQFCKIDYLDQPQTGFWKRKEREKESFESPAYVYQANL